ncbi:uncharacterized protein F5891DRAFT_1207327 [Suillus fuscotomentosus]|uniref:Uncharacterized protein n=1 Tax=Suillus fuscotomentosus TaxID=1912939 RepID=A0AAD4HNM0_9AGAM|nr:uncharacterized protein F5891DRAFT_1207327 [Suillus fuscotomentosus]KAG1904380.1 hypothetical protein F5891DRAFT_1207327 [Suillus fuscotomentosus]
MERQSVRTHARSSTNRLIIDRETTRALKIIPQRSIYSYTHKRRMSSTPSLPKFVVWARDYIDEGALERRLANAKKLISQGILLGRRRALDARIRRCSCSRHKVRWIYEGEIIDAIAMMQWDKEKIIILPDPIALATGLPPVPS